MIAARGTGVSTVAEHSTSAFALPATATCTNCGGGPVGRFCSACGQRRITPEDFTARTFAHELAGEVISVDGRFWHTLGTLVRHPGKLAREYFDGRGARYMRPLNLFLLLNLFFFLVQPHTGLLQWHLRGYLRGDAEAQRLVDTKRQERATPSQRLAASRSVPRAAAPAMEPMDLFESEFESTIQNLKKSMLLVAIPLFALALAAVYGQKRRVAEHLIFSTHFYAFSVFALLAVVPLGFMAIIGWLRLLNAPPSASRYLNGELPLTVILFGLFGTYLYFGLRRMYGDRPLAAVVRATLLFVAYQALVIAFSFGMFRVTLWVM